MSAIYDFKTSVIKIDSITNQIAKGVYELRRQNMPEPFVVQLTSMQFDVLRFECRGLATQFSVEEGNHIHGCKIEVIPMHNDQNMDSIYGDGSDHEACPRCGMCVTCGDCAAHGCGQTPNMKLKGDGNTPVENGHGI